MMEEETQLSPGSSDEQQSPQENQQNTRKKRNKNKRRFSNEQVKSLETIFESETKLEPRKKMQVARELGLQPRQVAIWFQNKRARWKSKQTEKNYRVLKANYEGLRVRFEALKEEKESLLEQLQQLNELLEKTHQGSSTSKDFTTNSPEKGRSNEENIGSFKEEPSGLQEDIDRQRVLYSDDENIAYLDQDEPELLQISENIDGSLASPVKWCSFEAGSLFDQSSSSSQWWDSWT